MNMQNRAFQMPPDGWLPLVTIGEWPHPSGVVQVIDQRAIDSMVKSFRAAGGEQSPRALIDFDHYSDLTDDERRALTAAGVQAPSEAAAWVADVQARPDGLYFMPDWTPQGKQAVEEGRYRFISPVFPRVACEAAGEGKLRPMAFSKAGLTNEPNIAVPALSNRAGDAMVRGPLVALANRVHVDSLANSETPKGSTMDYKATLCNLLGLDPATATDSEIENACKAMPNKAAQDALANRVRELEAAALTAQIDADLSALPADLPAAKRDEFKAALIANRATALPLVAAFVDASKARGTLPNRAAGQTPDGAAALSLEGVVSELRNRHPGWSTDQVFAQARSEHPELFGK